VKQTRVAIYTRVSTDDQSTSTQEHELRQYAKHRGWAVHRVYTDHGFSGASEKRPALDELLRDTRKRKFDVVLVWKFDRFARSLRQLVSALELFRKFGIDFVSATEAIDTSLPSGELVFQIFGAIAQFERALIGERVRAGLGEARRNGKRIGRPPVRTLTPEEVVRIRKEHRNGKSLRKLAKSYGVSLWAAHSACQSKPLIKGKRTTQAPCRSPKMDRIVIGPNCARHHISRVHRLAVRRIGRPASNGVGNQTKGRIPRNCGLAASPLRLETNPPIAPRKSPRTARTRLRERPLSCHTPGSGRSSILHRMQIR